MCQRSLIGGCNDETLSGVIRYRLLDMSRLRARWCMSLSSQFIEPLKAWLKLEMYHWLHLTALITSNIQKSIMWGKSESVSSVFTDNVCTIWTQRSMLQPKPQQQVMLVKFLWPCECNSPQKITKPLILCKKKYNMGMLMHEIQNQGWNYMITALDCERKAPRVREKSRSVCAWLLTPLSTLHHAIQTTQLAPFTFSIRLLCQLSLFTIQAFII